MSSIPAFSNLGALTSTGRDLDKVAIIDLGTGQERRFSYRDFEGQANAVARALIARGQVRGERVAILSANRFEFLTAVHGIGPWTADIYLLFALARRDAFAPGDLALQLAVQHHFKLERRPTAEELTRIAERWRPARAVAARLLWADYAFARRALLGKAEKPIVIKSHKSLK